MCHTGDVYDRRQRHKSRRREETRDLAVRLKPRAADPGEVGRNDSAEQSAARSEAASPRRLQGWQTAHTYLVTAAALVIVIAGMHAASGILVPFLLAMFVAGICAPLYQGMRRRRVPTPLAILAIMLVMLGGVMLLIGVVERAVSGFAANLPSYQASFLAQTDKIRLWLDANGIEISGELLRDQFNPQVLIRNLAAIAATLRDLLTTTFIVVLVAIFILLEGSALPDKVSRLPGFSSAGWDHLTRIVADMRRYMFLNTVMSLLTGVLVTLWLLPLGVDFPILLGVLAFALNYIPTIGSIVAAVPGILLAFIEFGLGTGAITAAGYLVINIGISNGIEPRYCGDSLGLSRLVVILSVLFWGWVLGPMGMLVSVPLTMTIKIALESDEHSRWLALLMAGRPKLRPRLRRGLAPSPAKPN
jgi:predicted PurR-regulated permease PerM